MKAIPWSPFWWGVDFQTDSDRRRSLGVDQHNSGTTRLQQINATDVYSLEIHRKGQQKAKSPGVRRKMADALRGRKRPRHVIAAMRKGRSGKAAVCSRESKNARGLEGSRTALRREPKSIRRRCTAGSI